LTGRLSWEAGSIGEFQSPLRKRLRLISCSYDITEDEWELWEYPTDSMNGPGARSVAALVHVRVTGTKYVITLFGERRPSDRGHEGAGQFWDDVWAFNVESHKSSKVEVKGDGGELPVSRGWFDADSWMDQEKGKWKILMQGGLNDENKRLGDVWVLEL